MNTNNFSSSSGALQGLTNSDRFKPLFKNTAETSSSASSASLKSTLGVDINIKALNGKQVFAKSIEFSLGVKLESSYEFKAPSPKDVASTVLGFVENRLNSEKASGASSERLNDLLAQARAGVEKGYAQAEKDIKDLGLMTEELQSEISEGFDLIAEGLTGFEQKFGVATAPDKLAPVQEDAKNKAEPAAPSVSADKADQQRVQLASDFFKGVSSRNDQSAAPRISSSMQVRDITASSADFVLKTREGDQVLIRFADIESLSARKNEEGMSLSLSQQSQFQFSVQGDLSEQEITAINEVLEQVGNISRLFFDEQFEQAFQSAMQLGFDSEQIASLSLDLSKTQVQEIRVYEGVAKGALESYKRNQPLINMVQQFERLEAMLSPLERFEELNSMVDELVEKAIERYSLIESKRSEEVNSAEKAELAESVDARNSIESQRLVEYQSFAQRVLSSMTEPAI